MISFAVITDTPARLASFLEARGIIKQETDRRTGEQYYIGVNPGMEWVKVANPIQTGVDGDGNPIMDTRHVYLVKFAHESEAEDADGPLTEGVDENGHPIPVNQYDRTKFGKWVMANSSVVTAPANYTINGEPVGDVRKINGQNVWLVRDNPERFGGWQ